MVPLEERKEEPWGRGSAKLVVRRDSDDDVKMRNLEVHVDGEWVADVAYGKRFETDLEPGEHEVMVTNRMRKERLEFTLEAGETAVFQGVNVLSKGASALAGAFGVIVYHPVLKRIE